MLLRLLHMKFAVLVYMLAELAAPALALAEDKSAEDEITPVVGVRGLDKNDAAARTSGRDYAAINRLDRVIVRSDELVQFLKEGNLR